MTCIEPITPDLTYPHQRQRLRMRISVARRLNRPSQPHPGPLMALLDQPHERSTASESGKPPASVPERAAPAKPRAAAVTLQADAERFLRRTGHGTSGDLSPRAWLRRAGLNVRRASDAQHLGAIALAYAAHLRIAASPEREAIMAELRAAAGGKPRRTVRDLPLVVDQFISYGDDTPRERLAARKLLSRDVRAIEHLHERGVLPSAVQDLGRRPGEGLHAWAGMRAATRKAKPTLPGLTDAKALAVVEQRERALVHKIVVTTSRRDGSHRKQRRFTVTGVGRAEFDACLRRLQALRPERV